MFLVDENDIEGACVLACRMKPPNLLERHVDKSLESRIRSSKLVRGNRWFYSTWWSDLVWPEERSILGISNLWCCFWRHGILVCFFSKIDDWSTKRCTPLWYLFISRERLFFLMRVTWLRSCSTGISQSKMQRKKQHPIGTSCPQLLDVTRTWTGTVVIGYFRDKTWGVGYQLHQNHWPLEIVWCMSWGEIRSLIWWRNGLYINILQDYYTYDMSYSFILHIHIIYTCPFQPIFGCSTRAIGGDPILCIDISQVTFPIPSMRRTVYWPIHQWLSFVVNVGK